MEIEKKFLVDEDILLSQIILNNYNREDIKQAYISTDDTEVRIRKIENVYCEYKCFMTIKSKGDLVREEVEFEIPYSKYRDLIGCKMYKGNIIEKIRYKIPLENELVAELDVYGGQLFGLISVEVEFKNKEDANNFIPPRWFGEEVTKNKKYKNKNLAMNLL